jgi:hypothetical protein
MVEDPQHSHHRRGGATDVEARTQPGRQQRPRLHQPKLLWWLALLPMLLVDKKKNDENGAPADKWKNGKG